MLYFPNTVLFYLIIIFVITRRKRCSLFGTDGSYNAEYSKGFVSGTLRGRCVNLAISQLRKCHCVDLANNDDYDYDSYDDRDLVGEGIIDVRGLGDDVCADNEGLRCVAEGAQQTIGSRSSLIGQRSVDQVNFGNRKDSAAVTFGA